MKKTILTVLFTGWTSITLAQQSVTIHPGVISTSDYGTMYIMAPGNEIAAVAANGIESWRSSAGHKPLYRQDDYLITMISPAEAGNLSLAVLRANDGSLASSASFDLPAEVIARIDDGLGDTFDVEIRYAEGNTYAIWTYFKQQVGGALLDPDNPPVAQTFEGAFELNLQLPSAELSANALSPAQVPSDRSTDIPQQAINLYENRQLQTEPVKVGDYVQAVQVTDNGAQVLRWDADSGGSVPAIALDAERSHVYNLSADQRYVAITEKNGRGFYRWKWSINDMASGQSLGEILSPYAIGPNLVNNDQIFYVEYPWQRREGSKVLSDPLSLRAVDLTTGNNVFNVEIRDTRYTGVTPP